MIEHTMLTSDRDRPPVAERSWAAHLAPIVLILAVVIGIGAFVGSERSIVTTGSQTCVSNCGTAATGPAATNNGAGSVSSQGFNSGVLSGGAGAGPSRTTAGSHDNGSLVLTGAQVLGLVLVALALLVVGGVLLRLGRGRNRDRSSSGT